jgi:hypothetical protein
VIAGLRQDLRTWQPRGLVSFNATSGFADVVTWGSAPGLDGATSEEAGR